MSAPPTLMLCVGATKAGTSWLFRYLSQHPQCHLRTIKELHFFDMREAGRMENAAERHDAMARQLSKRIETVPSTRLPDILAKMNDHATLAEVLRRGDDASYLAYLVAGRADERVVAEATPAYGLMPSEQLAMMAAILPDVRIVYLMRDPVERLWSHIRMMAGRRSSDGLVGPDHCRRLLRRTRKDKEGEIAIRSDYRGAIERLRAAVPAEKLLITYYESLFANPAPTQVCGFLGIDPLASDRQTLIHAGQEVPMPDELRAQARDWLAPQYDYVAQAVGDVPDAWMIDEAKVAG